MKRLLFVVFAAALLSPAAAFAQGGLPAYGSFGYRHAWGEPNPREWNRPPSYGEFNYRGYYGVYENLNAHPSHWYAPYEVRDQGFYYTPRYTPQNSGRYISTPGPRVRVDAGVRVSGGVRVSTGHGYWGRRR